jgi:hypothetical protein
MAWTWLSRFGILCGPSGLVIAVGYSGHAAGLNNPALQNVVDVGPLPEGDFAIGDPVDGTHLGDGAMPLAALPGTDTHGRSELWLHQDNVQHNESASEGCGILPLSALKAIAASPDRTLHVSSSPVTLSTQGAST